MATIMRKVRSSAISMVANDGDAIERQIAGFGCKARL